MFSLNGENVHYGTPVNPTDITRIPGGSSSGSAVAVASGAVDFALGTDTGGSVRIPASYCGVYGFRPTHGAVSINGVIPLARRFDTVGWMTREIDLLIEIGSHLIEQSKEKHSIERMIVPEDILELCSNECQQAFAKQIEKVKAFVKNIESRRIGSDGIEHWLHTFRTLQGYEVWQEHGRWIEENQPSFGKDIDQRFKWSSTITKAEYEQAKLEQETCKDQLLQLVDNDCFIIMPTSPSIAPPLHANGEQLEKQRKRTLLMTCISGITGAPQVSLPYMQVNGLPVGLSLIGAPKQDLVMLDWVRQFEREEKKLEESTIEISHY